MSGFTFDLEEWMERYTPYDFLNNGHFNAESITSPYDICNNEYLRQKAVGEFEWGESVASDIFIWARGEPEERSLTKTGGLPYRAASEPWPEDDDGEPRLFVAQFNFSESKDITGELPGEILLVFAKCDDGWFEELTFEWRDKTSEPLVTADGIPDHEKDFVPTYGYRFRTEHYPNAKPLFAGRYPQLAGRDIWRGDYYLPKYQATQISRTPFLIQSDHYEHDDIPKNARPLCTISSIQPAFDKPWPWVNREDSIPLNIPRQWRDKFLMISDMGCLYIFMDENNELYWREESY